jgi:hypothetical protein
VEEIRPAMHVMIDTWLACRKSADLDRLQALHYSDGSQHASVVVNLCQRLVSAVGESSSTLIYAHRGHCAPSKTPLLQNLLAQLSPNLQVQGLRVEDQDMPLDIVLSGIAALCDCDRCVIIKDSAVRLGTSGVLATNTIQYLVLSRSTGSWVIDDIVIPDAQAVLPMPSHSLDRFLADPPPDVDSLWLISRTTRSWTECIHVARVQRSMLPEMREAGAHLAGSVADAKPVLVSATMECGMSHSAWEDLNDA